MDTAQLALVISAFLEEDLVSIHLLSVTCWQPSTLHRHLHYLSVFALSVAAGYVLAVHRVESLPSLHGWQAQYLLLPALPQAQSLPRVHLSGRKDWYLHCLGRSHCERTVGASRQSLMLGAVNYEEELIVVIA